MSAKCAPRGGRSSRTRIVIRIATTPSVNACMRSGFIARLSQRGGSFDSREHELLVDLARQAADADRPDLPLAVVDTDAAEEEREERVEARPLDRVVGDLLV